MKKVGRRQRNRREEPRELHVKTRVCSVSNNSPFAVLFVNKITSKVPKVIYIPRL